MTGFPYFFKDEYFIACYTTLSLSPDGRTGCLRILTLGNTAPEQGGADISLG